VRWRTLAAALLGTVLLAAGCSGGGSHSTTSGAPLVTPSPHARNATTAPLLPTNRYALPELSLDRFNQLLAQLKGTPVVVNLWGSWCGPCREEGPNLARAGRVFGDRIQFLGVDERDDRTPAREFIRDEGFPYPSVFDPSQAIQTGLGFVGPPVTLLYDRAGHKVATFSGPVRDLAAFERALRRLLR
jgi:thiol-disulfide isomerase/thioredoxin